MSVGAFIGAVVGGIVGFFVGGPVGAYYGATLGFGVGMMIDPMMPDMPNIGIPDPGVQVMSGEIGSPIADLTGTVRITGHLLCYGKERNIYVEQPQQGGKGTGGDFGDVLKQGSMEPGWHYYMSWALGICACPEDPIDTLCAIYKNDNELVWPSPDADDGTWEGLELPVSGGQETIIIDGIGSCTFYFGTDDQVANTTVGEIISDATLNTPYRNLCWAFMDDCYIGQYNRTPTYKFVVKKIPQNAFSTKHEIQTYNVNPAHSMWYIFSTLAGLPETWLNSAGFSAMADTLHEESRGICVLFDKQQSVLSYIESINGHIDNIIRYGSDGEFHPKLIRDDYDIDSLLSIDENVMLDDPSFNRRSWIDTINEVKVQYTEMFGMPNRSRITNEYVEILRQGIPYARLTNEYVEVLKEGIPYARITNENVEVLRHGDPYARLTNEYVEVLQEI